MSCYKTLSMVESFPLFHHFVAVLISKSVHFCLLHHFVAALSSKSVDFCLDHCSASGNYRRGRLNEKSFRQIVVHPDFGRFNVGKSESRLHRRARKIWSATHWCRLTHLPVSLLAPVFCYMIFLC